MTGVTPQPPASPSDPVVQEKERQLALATLEAQIAEQRKNAVLSSLPVPAEKPPEGTTVVDDKVSIEGESLAYEALRVIASEIAQAIGRLRAGSVVLSHGPEDGTALATFRAFDAETRSSLNRIGSIAASEVRERRAATAAAVPALATIGATARTLVDLLALFRTNTEIKGREFTIGDSALAAAVNHQISTNPEISVYYPSVFPLEARVDSSASANVWATIDRIRSDLRAASARVAALGEAGAHFAAELTALESSQTALEMAITTLDPQTKETPLSKIIRGAALAEIVGPTGWLVWLKVLRAGGAVRIRRTLRGSKLSYSGSAIASYMIFSHDGRLVASNTSSRWSGFKSAD